MQRSESTHGLRDRRVGRLRKRGAKVGLLSYRRIGTVRQGFHVGRKVSDPINLMLWQKNGAKFRQVKSLVGSVLYATEVEVERVDVHVGFHRRAPKKQEPPPKERLRALLVEQSGVMIIKFLSVERGIIKSRTNRLIFHSERNETRKAEKRPRVRADRNSENACRICQTASG